MVGRSSRWLRAAALALAMCAGLATAKSLLDVIEPVRAAVVPREVTYEAVNASDESRIVDALSGNALVGALLDELRLQGVQVEGLRPRVSRTLTKTAGAAEQRTANVYYGAKLEGDMQLLVRVTVAVLPDAVDVLSLNYRKERASPLEAAPVEPPEMVRVDDEVVRNVTAAALTHPKLAPIAGDLLDAGLYKVYAPPFAKDGQVPLAFIPIEGRCRLPVAASELDVLHAKRLGLCDACACPAEENLVCGDDWLTYANPCLARCAGAEVRYAGQCKSDCGIYGTVTVDVAAASLEVGRIGIKDSVARPFGPVVRCKPKGCGDALERYADAASEVVKDLQGLRDGLERLDQREMSAIAQNDIALLSKTFDLGLECAGDDDCGFSSCGCACRPEGGAGGPPRGKVECAQFCPVRYSCACVQGRCVNKQKVCVCPTLYKPVCGVDGKTYASACNAECAGVKVAHAGACSQDVCVARLGLVEGAEALAKAVGGHVLSCRGAKDRARATATSLAKLGDGDAVLRTTYFDLGDGTGAVEAGDRAAFVTCTSQVRFERVEVAVAAEASGAGAKPRAVAPRPHAGLMDVRVTSVSCASELVDARFAEPSFCETSDQCVRQRSCCECDRPTYVNGYHLREVLCELACDCVAPAGERYAGECRDGRCMALELKDERSCTSSKDCSLQTDCCGLQARCTNRPLAVARQDCRGILCPMMYVEPGRCVCRDGSCALVGADSCADDGECAHLACPQPRCTDGACACKEPPPSTCGNERCERGEELECKDCSGSVVVTLPGGDRARLNERVEVVARYASAYGESLERGTCSMDVEVLAPRLLAQEGEATREVFSASVAELDALGSSKAALAPDKAERSVGRRIPMAYDGKRGAFVGSYLPERYGVHYISVTCYLHPKAPSLAQAKVLVQMDRCQQEGGHCTHFQADCKYGYREAEAGWCQSRSEKCCVPSPVKGCDEECKAKGHTGGTCRSWPVVPEPKRCGEGETLIASDECAAPEGKRGVEAGCCCKERGEACICPSLYEPVCGTDGKTYPNGCALKCAKAELLHAGACAKDCVRECGDDELCAKRCDCLGKCRKQVECFKAPCPLGAADESCVRGCVGAERVTCAFKRSATVQECYSAKGGCKGVKECTVEFLGKQGEEVVWKSSCGGYATTVVGTDRNRAVFGCPCTKAGEVARNPSLGPSDPDGVCCEGLIELQPKASCGERAIMGAGVICSDCGNGRCEEWEGECNCPADCKAETPCAKEGERFSKVFKEYPERCCEGLTEWGSGMDTRKVVDGRCTETGLLAGSPVGTCIRCGDGACEGVESVCNCPEDCGCKDMPCPMLSPPAPGFCEGGKVVARKNACGCVTGYECVRACASGLDAKACEAAGGRYDSCPMRPCPKGMACTQVCGTPVCACPATGGAVSITPVGGEPMPVEGPIAVSR